MDALRADRILSIYKGKSLTPFINNFLKESIYFENCIANSTWTLPSHFSMFTGLYEHQNYSLTKNIYQYSKKIPILAQILKDFGYFTFCYTENPYLARETGLLRGFDYTFLNWDLLSQDNRLDKIDRYVRAILKLGFWFNFWHKVKIILDKIIKNLNWIRWMSNRYVNPREQIEINLQKFLLKIKKKPFFLFFNIMATHSPYISSKKILKSFGITNKDFEILKNIFLYPLEHFIKTNFNSKRLSDNEIDVLQKFYNSSVFYCDSIVKEIIAKLKNIGLLEDTQIIITSDHGELLGNSDDHYYWTHGVFHGVYEQLIKVPLIIYSANSKNKKIKNQVELKDLFHTILHLTGIPKEKNEYLEINKSLIHQINKNSTPKYVFGEFIKDKKEMLYRVNLHKRNLNENIIPKLLSNIFFLRSEKYKLISYGNKIDEFYDISNDPYEKINLANDKIEEYKEMKLFLQNYLKNVIRTENIRKLVTKNEINLIKKAISKISLK